MFTNNYIAFRHNMFFGLSSGTTAGGITGKYLTDVNGLSFGMRDTSNYHVYSDIGHAMGSAKCQAIPTGKASSYSNTGYGVYFGSGSTPVEKGDYTLESPIISGLSISSNLTKRFLNHGNGKYTVSAFYVVTNTTSGNLNISEIGCFTPVRKSATNEEYYLIMMDRTVLTEPITIAPGETKLITYKITFNHGV